MFLLNGFFSKHWSGGASLLLVAALLLGASPAYGQIYVDKDASGAGNGSTWADAYTDLQTAIDNATGSDELWVAEGIYTPDSESDSFTLPGAKDGLEVYGGFEGTESTRSERDAGDHPTVLSGDVDGDDNTSAVGVTEAPGDINGTNSNHVLVLDGTTDAITTATVFDGLTVTAGQATGTGSEDSGAGLYCDAGASAAECSPTLRNVVFVGNTADQGGGAIYLNSDGGDASPRIVNTLFVNNAAQNGGGIYTVSLAGGTSKPRIRTSVFTNNTASGSGGALYVPESATEPGTGFPQISNSILWGNAPDQVDIVNSADVAFSHSIVEGGIPGTDNGGNRTADPQFQNAANPAGPDGRFATRDDGVRVQRSSPAIDAGTNDSVSVAVDLTGIERIQDRELSGTATVDIGAYESAIFRVEAGNSGPQDGASWSTAYASLQDALAQSGPTDEIWIAEGVYYPDVGEDVSDGKTDTSFVIGGRQDGLGLYGGFSGTESSRSARDPGSNPTVLSGDVDENDDPFEPNTDSDGDPDTPTQTDHIRGNNSNHVLFLDGTSNALTEKTLIDGVTVTAGEATGSEQAGGGLYCDGEGNGSGTSSSKFTCSPTLRNVVFAGNRAEFSGGALQNNGRNDGGSSPRLTNVVFVGNATYRTAGGTKGGALYNDAVGGIDGGTSSPVITNTTFYANRAAKGGVMFSDAFDNATAQPQITNSILWDNSASGSGDEINNANGASPVLAHTIIQGGVNGTGVAGDPNTDGGNNLDQDPLLEYAPLPAGDDGTFGTDDDGLHLTPGSPAIDAGDGTAVSLANDLTGASRVQNGTVDIGAYEGGRDSARTIYVDSGNTSGTVDGTSWTTADTTLQDTTSLASGALGYATGNDEIWVAEGVYTPAGSETSLTITGRQDGLKIYGGFESGDAFADRAPGDHPVVLSGDVGGDDDNKTASGVTPTAGDIKGSNSHHVLTLNSSAQDITPSTVIEGLTITGGQANGSGPATQGGGLYCSGVDGVCTPVLRNLVFVGNTADGGGAIYNAAVGFNRSGAASPTIVNSVFAENRAQDGGAILNSAQSPGATAATASPTITNTTFVGNTASNNGGALFNGESSDEGTSSDPDLTNVILYGNTAASGGQSYSVNGATPSLDYTLVEGGCPSDANCSNLVTDDPRLADTTDADGPDGTFATVDDGLNLTPGSPALDAGDNSSVSASTDLTRAPRTQDFDGDATATVNIGAYEPPSPIAPAVVDASTFDISQNDASITGSVNPGGLPTTVRVQYGRDTAFAADSVTTAASDMTGYVAQSVSGQITGLDPGTTYSFRLQAENSAGITTGNIRTFTTKVAVPQVTTRAPVSITDTSALVRGTLNPRGGATRLYVALSRASSGTTMLSPIDTVRTNLLSDQLVSVTIDTLRSSTEYRYEIVAANAADSLKGGQQLFKTANVLPKAVDDTATTIEAQSVIIDVLENDTDEDGTLDTTSVEITHAPEAGTASYEGEGAVQYRHDGSSTLSDQFRYRVADDAGRYDTAAVDVQVQEMALTAQSDTVELGGQRVEQPGDTTDVTIENTGEVPLTGLEAAIQGAGSGAFASVVDTGEDSLASGQTRTVEVAFRPEEVGGRQAVLTVTSADGPEAVARLTGRGVSVDVQTASLVRGTEASVSVTVDGGFVPKGRSELFVRKGGTTAYQSVPLQIEEIETSGRVLLTGTIPAGLITERGIDYYGVLSDETSTIAVPGASPAQAAAAPRHRSVHVEAITAQGPLVAEEYRMISVPMRPEERGIREVFESNYDSYDPSTWRLFRWDPSSGDYREYPEIDTLRPGDGAWLVTSDSSALTLRDAHTVEASTPYRIPLSEGWNQVGVPFGFAVPWDSVQAATDIAPADLGGPVAYGDTSSGTSSQRTYQYDRSALRPWQGYFVYNGTGAPDTLVVPPVGEGTGGTQMSTAQNGSDEGMRKAASESSYSLRVTAHADETTQRIRLGLRSGAAPGRDRFDRAQAPPIGKSVRLAIMEEVHGEPIPHAKSVKPSDTQGQSWRLMLSGGGTGNEEPSVRLHLHEQGTLPEGYERYVLDPATGRRLAPGAPLSLAEGEERTLKVILGTKSYAQAESEGIGLEAFANELRGNYPNPFRDETTIAYTLKEEQEVTVTVYNVLGQTVRTLVEEEKDAGRHRVRWTGDNRYGDPVGSGVYFYRIDAGDFTATRKMMVVR